MTILHMLGFRASVVTVVLAGLMTACANQPTKQAPQIESAPVSKGRVYIYRDSYMLRGRDAAILVDGKQVAVLGNREYLSVLVGEGSHEITTKWAFDLNVPVAKYSLTAMSQSVSFLRLYIDKVAQGTMLTGSPILPIMSTVEFGSGFISQDHARAFEEMSYCSLVNAQ